MREAVLCRRMSGDGNRAAVVFQFAYQGDLIVWYEDNLLFLIVITSSQYLCSYISD